MKIPFSWSNKARHQVSEASMPCAGATISCTPSVLNFFSIYIQVSHLFIFSIVKISSGKKTPHKYHKMTIVQETQALRTFFYQRMKLLSSLGIGWSFKMLLIQVEIVPITATANKLRLITKIV